MIPFIYFNLKNLMLKLLEIVVKPATFENCKRGHKLMDIDLSYNQNLIFFWKTKIFAATGTADIVNVDQIKGFMKDNQLERSPLGSSFLQGTSLFDSDELLITNFSEILL